LKNPFKFLTTDLEQRGPPPLDGEESDDRLPKTRKQGYLLSVQVRSVRQAKSVSLDQLTIKLYKHGGHMNFVI